MFPQDSSLSFLYLCKVNDKQWYCKIFKMIKLNLPPYPARVTEHKHYPAALLANEVRLTIGDKSVRADSVLYDASLHARMIVEYKAPHIPITQKVFDQISVYNLLLHVDYLVVSNGMQTYICKMDYAHQKYLFLKDIPDYTDI